jgi:hypothetical protein
MIKLDVSLSGAEKMIRALSGAKRTIQDEVRIATEQAMQPTSDELRIYPPPPPASRYKRTGRYRAGISNPVVTMESGGAIHGRIEQRAPYSRYVRGDQDGQGQAWMHVGRWETSKSIVGRLVTRLTNRLNAALQNLIGSKFGG